MTSLFALIPIAFVLSLDNFQSSIGLGTTKPSWIRIVQCALIFGIFDALAPMLGVWVGGYLGDYIGESAEYIGAAALAVYAVYLVVHALRTEEKSGEIDHPLAILGLPLPLSIDNLLAGAGLGVMGYSAVTVAVVAGSVTLVMSLVGLTLGKLAASKIPVRTDLLGGVVMLILATAMVVRA
jgi:putative Mn2+ efflux pump MntP